MFDRREATQYHPKVQRYERYNVVPRRMQLSPDRHRVDILPVVPSPLLNAFDEMNARPGVPPAGYGAV
jgi:hypothetical protein